MTSAGVLRPHAGALRTHAGALRPCGLLPLLITALLVTPACARPGGPPGGVPDVDPPRVVATAPDTFAVLDEPPSRVEIHFDDRISERAAEGPLDQAVLVSPQTGTVRVSHRRRSLEVEVSGGFRRGVVYQVTVLPVVNDMFRNTLETPFEFFFSTGPDFPPNVLAGLVTDRLTGMPVAGARVDAHPEGDSLAYVAETDEQGLFSMRFIPPGPYTLVAYEDRNRNRTPDFVEPQDTSFATLGAADTVVVLDLALLQPDSTPATLASVVVEDSVTLRVTLSDPLDPAVALDDVEAALARDDEGEAPRVERVLHAHELDALLRAEAAEAAEVAAREAAAMADTAEAAARPDTAPLPRPPVEEPPPVEPLPEADPGAQAAAEPPPLPSRELGVRLAEPLEPGAPYRLTLSGIRNINGVPGGGGEAAFTAPVAPEPEAEREPGEERDPGGDRGSLPERDPGAARDPDGGR